MHLEVLVEDQSGKRMLDVVLPKLMGEHTFKVHAYRGIGRIPKGLAGKSEPAKRILLDQLPRILQGYGNAFATYPTDYLAHVAVVCDLDNRNLAAFIGELKTTLDRCKRKPRTEFCLAIEEGEAWLLGDRSAIMNAYPRAHTTILDGYVQDSICGTWEVLANALYPGGAAALIQKGWQAIGHEKSKWADTIGPLIDVNRNCSPSFRYFVTRLRSLGY